MKITKRIATAFVVIALGASVFADEAYDIVKKSSTLEAPDTSQAVMMLSNIEKNGATELREMRQYGRKVNGLKSTVFDFRSPASVKDTRVLQAEKNGHEDDRWIYMPNMRQVRRIPMGERYKQFVGCEEKCVCQRHSTATALRLSWSLSPTISITACRNLCLKNVDICATIRRLSAPSRKDSKQVSLERTQLAAP